MKIDVVLCGVGGQGVLTLAGILAEAARRRGLHVRQGEIHGMSQRGGAVEATLRLSDAPIAGPQIARGRADLLLATEPLEALRHVHRLAPQGVTVAAADPVDDMDGYPPLDELHARIRALPRAVLVPAVALAREAGAAKSANVVVAGAALPFLPLDVEGVEGVLRDAFEARGDRIVQANLKALSAGLAQAEAPNS